jgi:hypothetical protein
MKRIRKSAAAFAAIATAAAGMLAGSGVLATSASAATAHPANGPSSYIGQFHHIKVVASTVPKNGDVNPYGVAVVPRSTGKLHRGNILVSNFNDKTNAQGTGTTIVQVGKHGGQSLFAQISDPSCPGGIGLTTALVALRSGWVIVGSLPTMNGNISGPGCLIVLDPWGHVRKTITGHGIDGPWDMTALDRSGRGVAELFVTNVLGGILGSHHSSHGGTVERLLITSNSNHVPRVLASKQIGSGFAARLDVNALVIGPTGVGLGRGGTLYVADTLNSRIAAIPNAVFRRHSDGTGRTVTQGGKLNFPLGLVIAPNGHIVTANGGDGNLVETTPRGKLAAVVTVDMNSGGAGNLFGLAIKPCGQGVYFVDDFSMDNNLQLLF